MMTYSDCRFSFGIDYQSLYTLIENQIKQLSPSGRSMAVPLELIQTFKPIVYLPKEGKQRRLVDILYESDNKYAILWFHWPFDDYTNKSDYEPVVLVYRDNLLHRIGIRPHQRYLSYRSWKTEGSRPIVVFHTAWHAPMIQGTNWGTLVGLYSTVERSNRLDNYTLKKGRPPEWYNKNGAKKGIYSFANEISS